jgi:hypothetical protein
VKKRKNTIRGNKLEQKRGKSITTRRGPPLQEEAEKEDQISGQNNSEPTPQLAPRCHVPVLMLCFRSSSAPHTCLS